MNCRRCSGGLQTVEALGVAAKGCGFAGWFFDRRSENAATTDSSNESIGIDGILGLNSHELAKNLFCGYFNCCGLG